MVSCIGPSKPLLFPFVHLESKGKKTTLHIWVDRSWKVKSHRWQNTSEIKIQKKQGKNGGNVWPSPTGTQAELIGGRIIAGFLVHVDGRLSMLISTWEGNCDLPSTVGFGTHSDVWYLGHKENTEIIQTLAWRGKMLFAQSFFQQFLLSLLYTA